MARQKPSCPNCGAQTFTMRQTFGIKGDCHELERKRYAYYKCDKCGCECLLYTPQGRLEVIRDGNITPEMTKRVLQALGLPLDLSTRLDHQITKR